MSGRKAQPTRWMPGFWGVGFNLNGPNAWKVKFHTNSLIKIDYFKRKVAKSLSTQRHSIHILTLNLCVAASWR
jgi:hypothetical protein